MNHPMVAQLGITPQMGSLFDQFYDAIKQAGQGAIDEAKAKALASTATIVANDPNIQAAVIQQGEKAAYEKLIDNLVSGRQAITGFVQENPYKTVMLVGGGLVAVGLLIYFLKK